MSDYTQILAFCLARIDKELAKQKALIEERLSSSISESAIQDLRHGLVEEANNTFISELPPGIVYETHLQDAVKQLTVVLESLEVKSGEALTTQTRNLLERIQGASNEILEEVSRKAEAHHLHEQYSTVDQLKFTSDRLDYHVQNTAERLQELSDRTQGISQANENAIAAERMERSAVETRVLDKIQKLDKDIAELIESVVDHLTEKSESSHNKLQEDLSKHKAYYEAMLERSKAEAEESYNKIFQIHSHLYKKVDQKSDADHTHDELAKKNHQHSEYLTHKEGEDLSRSISLLSNEDALIRQEISKLVYELSSKVDATEAFTKKDIDHLVEQAQNAVLQRIKLPEDGKDAHEWEFRVHPNAPGVFQFKRSDQAQWKNVSLPRSNQAGGFGGVGGGGGSGTNDLTILVDGEVVEGSVTQIEFVGHNVTKIGEHKVRVEVVGGGSGGGVSDAPYVQNLTGLSTTIPNSVHGKQQYAFVRVYDSNRREALLDVYQDESGNVHVSSLIDLQGYYIVISNP